MSNFFTSPNKNGEIYGYFFSRFLKMPKSIQNSPKLVPMFFPPRGFLIIQWGNPDQHQAHLACPVAKRPVAVAGCGAQRAAALGDAAAGGLIGGPRRLRGPGVSLRALPPSAAAALWRNHWRRWFLYGTSMI